MEQSRARLVEVMSGAPALGYGGFYASDEDREKGRKRLLDDVESFEATVEWLHRQDLVTVKGMQINSYGAKHIVEDDIGHISNGVFIAAAIHCGYKYQIPFYGLNCDFNIAINSMRKIRRLQDARQQRAGELLWLKTQYGTCSDDPYLVARITELEGWLEAEKKRSMHGTMALRDPAMLALVGPWTA